MQNIDWNNIRSINGSQKDGFEELVCQLARNETFPNSKHFVRKGSPDAGVECFWTLEDDSEIAWQAKFFTSPLSSAQWAEIDKSVKTMLNKHPKTKKYIISIPQDRADARVDGQKSFLQKWDDRVLKWEKWAKEKNLSIIFEYEGSSELLNKLSLPINLGKTFFWFNQNEFTSEWFKKQNDLKIKDLGARYSPELNVELDIKYVFDGLYFDKEYKEKTTTAIDEIDIKFQELIQNIEDDKFIKFKNKCIPLYNSFKQEVIDIDIINSAKYELLLNTIQLIRTTFLSSKSHYLGEMLSKKDNSLERVKTSLKNLENKLYKYISLFRHTDIELAEKPILIIEGDAGAGKSHLIADVIKDKYIKNQYSILFLGQHFVRGNVWEQILKELDLKISKEEFLGALNSKAESLDSRIIIFIDAINEGEGKYIWEDRIRGIIDEIKQYKYLGITFSIRSSYIDIVLPENFLNEVNHFEHKGLGENTTKAVSVFFDHYKIEEPPIPILDPEFSNPLFLKLFCKGLYDNGLNKIPNGYSGISTIFNYITEAANKAISNRLDYHHKTFNIVKEAVEILTVEITKTTSFIISKETANKTLTEKLQNNVNDSRNVLIELINENILTENAIYNNDTERYDKEAIYFSYERFGDHLIVNALLEKEKNKIIENRSINRESNLFTYIKNEDAITFNKGIVDALSIQLPEKFDIELYEVVPKNDIYELGESFLDSLIWRSKDSINDKVLDYINNYILTVHGLEELFKDTLISLSVRKDHYFNARFLDANLFELPLNERDHYWTIYINDSIYGTPLTIINWVRERSVLDNIDEETKRLLSLILSWFLTSSNRELRDTSTKALVKLFQNDISLFCKLLLHFQDVNDVYILERLYAVAYAITLRSNNDNEIKVLAEFIFVNVFQNRIPIEHLLLRDYARGVIEFAKYRNEVSNINLEEIRPPYGSLMPSDLPSEEDIEQYNIEKNEASITQNQLFDYVTGFSDFARYTIGTNGPSEISLVTIQSMLAYQKLKKSLKKKEKESLESYYQILKDFNDERVSDDYKKMLELIIKEGHHFVSKIFNIPNKEATLVYEYMNTSVKANNFFDKSGRFDLSILQRLIIKEVFESSRWELEKFQHYDFRKFDYFNKESFNRIEAIGKKYIWIAYYKWLSIIFDNYLISNDHTFASKWGVYDGTWSPFERDIDPSLLIKDAIKENEYSKSEPTFWSPTTKLNLKENNYDKWVFDKSDIINPKNLIEITDNNNIWLNLSSMPSWRTNKKDGDLDVKKEVWYHIKSYIIKKENKESILKELKGKSFWNYSIPQEREVYEVFSREYYWSEAYKHRTYDEESRLLHSSFKEDKLSGSITSIRYMWYKNRDFSLNENIYITKPSKELFDVLDLTIEENEHCFYDRNGELILYSPAIELQKGVDSLLVRKDILLNNLKEKDLDIIWLVLGAKEVIASNKITNESHINNTFYFDEDDNLVGDFTLEKRKV